ncbi:MAG: KTSC domain-containing protein [Endozoicomonas sp.]
MKKLLIAQLFWFYSSVWAAGCPVYIPDLSLYYGNGMFNEPEEASDSVRKLQRLMNGQLLYHDVSYKISYNHNENPIEQILEVARQKLLQDYSSILLWLSGIDEAPDWFQEALEDTVAGYQAFSYIFDGDLQRHVADYTQDITSCRKVLLVAHSQGNFYGNEAWRYVYQNTVDNLPFSRLKLMGMVSVATPSSQLGEPLAYEEDLAAITRYLTLTDDLVINVLRSYNFGPLPANLTNNTESDDWKNHSFSGTYLFGSPSRGVLQSQIREVAYSLETLPFARQGLDSSALASAGYDPAAQILEVEFASSGSVYRYYDVPDNIYRGLISADSVGGFYNLSIRGQYPSRRLY